MVETENMEIVENLPNEDNTEFLVQEEKICRKNGKIEDIPAFQGIICLILAAAMILLNIKMPDMAEELYTLVKKYSYSEQEIFENPINIITELIKSYAENKS